MKKHSQFAAIALIAGVLSGLLSGLCYASDSPVGLWKNIDDKTGKPKALIRITETNGVLQGKIEKLLRSPNEDQNPKCTQCDDANKDQPILGMTILSGFTQDGDE